MMVTDHALALANSTVREVDGLLYISEPIDTFRMTRHIQLWAADLQGDVDKLDVLMASGIMNDLSLLMATVNQMAADSAGDDSAQPTDYNRKSARDEDANTLRRFKRNIIGDVLHFVSGVPTDEMMAKQVKLDEEIRDKVTATLTRQMAYERSVTDVIGNITREEEVLGHHLEKLAKKHTQDVSKITRFATHRQVILDDMDKLEDILEALWTGTVNTRHAVYLSSRAGLKQVATFRTVGITAGRGGPTVRYVTRLYKATTIMATDRRPTYNSVATLDRLYYLHPGHSLQAPISEMEVRGTRVHCPSCAIVVYVNEHLYQAVQPGHISCQHVDGGVVYNLTMGQSLYLMEGDTCSNEAVYIGKSLLRLQEYKIDSTGDSATDALLARKTSSPDTEVETMAAMKAAHAVVNLKLHHAVASAQEDIATFVQDTSLQLDGFNITTGVSLGGLAIVAGILLAIVTCIFCRCIAARRAVAHTGPVMEMA
jgi:ribosomal 50S subunit-associated protein YjgA (DUF615 family)